MSGTWGPLNNQPTFGVGTMLLLTDGTVMAQNSFTPHWWRLRPDITGSYVNGTWSQLADGPNGPLYFASAVLRDGRVFVAGGEYNSGGGGDLVANAWSVAANMLHGTTNEETWTLLQDQTIVVCDCAGHPATEKYLIASNQWITCGNTPTDLVEASSIEIGPALALPDGRLFAVGATGQTALYTMPPISSQPGTWAQGPTFPVVSGKQLGAKDAPGCLLPNGLVLCAVGPVDGVAGNYLSPTYFYEFNPATNTLAATNDPPTSGGPPYVGRFLLLPTGQVLFANGTANVQVYTPTGAPDLMWKPNITSVPTILFRGATYTLYGRQINGLSQAVSYGDDATMATNYPIVRLRNNATGHVFYCRTFNHSTMGVNTGTVVHHTQFTLPANAELGASTITVIANGIASDPVAVEVIVIKRKEIKEIKLEKIEKIEAKVEAKELEIATGGEPSGQTDANLAAVIRMLAERADQAEVEKEQQRAFIQPEERPEVGSAAIDALPPPSKAKSKE